MLDSDDLLARDYLSRAAELVEEEHGDGGDIATTTSGGHTGTGGVDIIPGCMRNFDAVSSDWCFRKASPSSAFRTGTNFMPRF